MDQQAERWIIVVSEAEHFVQNEISTILSTINTNNEIQALSESLLKMEIGINNYIENLKIVTAEKERIRAELNVVAQIQADMLQGIFPAFHGKNEFEIYAPMSSAKEVEGDLIISVSKRRKIMSKTRKELVVEATIENITRVTEFVDSHLEEYGCPIKAQMQIDIAIDELLGNIVHYAYTSAVGTATVQVEVIEDPLAAIITFIDNGIPYNPLAKDDPDITLSLEEREIGGLGIYMVKKSMDEIIYEYKSGQNILKIKKNF